MELLMKQHNPEALLSQDTERRRGVEQWQDTMAQLQLLARKKGELQ